VDALVDRQAADVVLLDLRELSAFAEYFIVATVDNVRQARAILDHVTDTVAGLGATRPHPEGSPDTGWVLLDLGGGVILHVFSLEARARYDLEGLWSRAQEVVRIQ
jgi:ribosome-associated protein